MICRSNIRRCSSFSAVVIIDAVGRPWRSNVPLGLLFSIQSDNAGIMITHTTRSHVMQGKKDILFGENISAGILRTGVQAGRGPGTGCRFSDEGSYPIIQVTKRAIHHVMLGVDEKTNLCFECDYGLQQPVKAENVAFERLQRRSSTAIVLSFRYIFTRYNERTQEFRLVVVVERRIRYIYQNKPRVARIVG